MIIVNCGRAGVFGVVLAMLGACSAPSVEEVGSLGSALVKPGAETTNEPRGFYPGSMARGRSRGHDGAKRQGMHDRSCDTAQSVSLTPDATGWLDESSNPLGIQGPWYVYSDGNGADGLRDGLCQAVGHADSECSSITSPALGPVGFANVGGRMCTSGSVAQVLDLDGAPDYGHMYGAGMAFILAFDTATQQFGVFDARAQHVIGFEFDLDTVPAAGLYVGLATPASDIGSLGPDYWGANAAFQSSPVVSGRNVVLLRDVRSPQPIPEPIDVTQLETLEFQVRSSTTQPSSFAYCISNVKALLAR
jgi:hypothetical protein